MSTVSIVSIGIAHELHMKIGKATLFQFINYFFMNKDLQENILYIYNKVEVIDVG